MTPLVPCLHSACPLPTGSGNHHAPPPTCLSSVSALLKYWVGRPAASEPRRAKGREEAAPRAFVIGQPLSLDHKSQMSLRLPPQPLYPLGLVVRSTWAGSVVPQQAGVANARVPASECSLRQAGQTERRDPSSKQVKWVRFEKNDLGGIQSITM